MNLITRAYDYRQLAASLVGARIAAVFLSSLEEKPYMLRVEDDSTVCEATAVDLVFENGLNLRVTWVISGELEGLSVGVPPEAGGYASFRVDASESASWNDIVGHEIDSVRLAWHRPDPRPGTPECLWSIGIDVAPNQSVTIALGEVTESVLRYVPDSVIVMPAKSIPAKYEIATSLSSSWGASPEAR